MSVSESPVDKSLHTVSALRDTVCGVDNHQFIVMILRLLSWRLLLPMRLVILSHPRASRACLETWLYTQSMRRLHLISAQQLHSLKQKIYVSLLGTPVTSMSRSHSGYEVVNVADYLAIATQANQLGQVLFRFGLITSKTSNI